VKGELAGAKLGESDAMNGFGHTLTEEMHLDGSLFELLGRKIDLKGDRDLVAKAVAGPENGERKGRLVGCGVKDVEIDPLEECGWRRRQGASCKEHEGQDGRDNGEAHGSMANKDEPQ